jgi:hypothetical protein
MRFKTLSVVVVFAILISCSALAQGPNLDFLNHNKPILDAHNCYPYEGRWNDRIQRALNSGFPVSIEQDLAWYVDPATGKGRVVVSHTPHPTGSEPTLEDYFFKQVTPVMAKILAENKQSQWPLIVLHFDFKDNQAPLLEAVWQVLGQHEEWLSTAVKSNDPAVLAPIERKPILVVTEEADEQQKVFYDALPVGGKLRLFGSAHTTAAPKGLTREQSVHWAAPARPISSMRSPPTIVAGGTAPGTWLRRGVSRRLATGPQPTISGFTLSSIMHMGWVSGCAFMRWMGSLRRKTRVGV